MSSTALLLAGKATKASSHICSATILPLAQYPLTVAQAEGAEEAAVLVVAALVEQPADLVHPAFALVALHPALLHLQSKGRLNRQLAHYD